jgi:hypothetical protein
MRAVIKERPRVRPFVEKLIEINQLAQSCSRQLGAWMLSIEDSPVKGKRYLDAKSRQPKQTRKVAREESAHGNRHTVTTNGYR